MANKKTDASVLVRGLGMGAAFLQALTEAIVEAGGFEEMIHFLSREAALPLCAKLAKVVVESEWQIPRSLVERLSVAIARRGYTIFERYDWVLAIRERFQNVPLQGFTAEPMVGNSDKPIPADVVGQIVGTPLPYPMIVYLEGEPFVVVSVHLSPWEKPYEGMVIKPGRLERIVLAPASCFNLEQ